MRDAEDVRRRLESIDPHSVQPGLQRIRALLEALGSPHLTYPTAVICGTNGKGSVAAMLASIGRAAGHRVGLYTSPHLTFLEDRFQVDGDPISPTGLDTQLEEVFGVADRLHAQGRVNEFPSYFEILTAAAFRYFAEARVDLAILEVGLGGRWDATNVTRPRVVVITSIDLDHREYLGDDLPSIAAEKAAVVPPAGLAVTAPQDPAALEVLRSHCCEVGATLWESEQYPLVDRPGDERLHYSIDCVGRVRTYVGLDVALAGAHQVENARCALLAAEALDRHRLSISSDAIWAGLRSVRWPGRCEWLGEEPPILLDAAHNSEAATALASYLAELERRGAYDKLHLVVGVLADKDAEEITRSLYPLADTLVTTAPPSPRALPAAALLQSHGLPASHSSVPDPWAALEQARQGAAPGDLVCVAGSSYLVGALRPRLVG
jgi:dihydrofolate synthase/folylpolyglutamate synthase